MLAHLDCSFDNPIDFSMDNIPIFVRLRMYKPMSENIRSVILAIILISMSLFSLVEGGTVEKMRVVVIPLKSSVPSDDVKHNIARIEEELNQADEYFTVLQRNNLSAVLGEVRLSYEDWMAKYRGDTEIQTRMQGITADHILFVTLGRGSSGFFINATMTKIVTLEQTSVSTISDSDPSSLSGKGVKRLVNDIIKKHFESEVVLISGSNGIQCSIRNLDYADGYRNDVSFNGQQSITVPYGNYEFTFNKKNFRPFVTEEFINAQRFEIQYSPNRREADIKLSGTPSSAQILIDGKIVKEGFPFLGTYPEGKYHIVVRKKGFNEWSDKIEIKDRQNYIRPQINLERPPFWGALLKSSILPGSGQYSLGYKRDGLLFAGGYFAALGLGIGSQLMYHEQDQDYQLLRSKYLNMTSGTQEEFNLAREESNKAQSRRQLWNISRVAGFTGIGVIWIWAGADTWIKAGTNDINPNLSLNFHSNEVSLAYNF